MYRFGCGAARVVLLLLPETMWCLRLLLLVALLPSSSSVKRGRTPAGNPLISSCFPKLSSAPADAPATPIQDVTRGKFRRGLQLSEGGTTAWTKGGTEALQHVEKDCMVKVEGETKVKRRLFSWYHPNDLCPTRVTMLERARTDALSDEEKKAFNKKKKQGMYVESHPQS